MPKFVSAALRAKADAIEIGLEAPPGGGRRVCLLCLALQMFLLYQIWSTIDETKCYVHSE